LKSLPEIPIQLGLNLPPDDAESLVHRAAHGLQFSLSHLLEALEFAFQSMGCRVESLEKLPTPQSESALHTFLYASEFRIQAIHHGLSQIPRGASDAFGQVRTQPLNDLAGMGPLLQQGKRYRPLQLLRSHSTGPPQGPEHPNKENDD
jgi:hypothetical protein